MLNANEHKNVEKVIRYYLTFLPPRDVKSILDIGCGCSAPYGGMLKNRCQKYLSLDIRAGNKVMYVCDVADGTNLKDKEFEWGWCSEVLEHIDPVKKERAVKEIMRVCENCVFTYPTPQLPQFADDVGHTEVKIDWKEFSKEYDVIDKTTKNGRAIIILKQKGYIAPNNQGTLL